MAGQQFRDAKFYEFADAARAAVNNFHNFQVVSGLGYTEIVNVSGEDWYMVEDAETGAQMLMGPT